LPLVYNKKEHAFGKKIDFTWTMKCPDCCKNAIDVSTEPPSSDLATNNVQPLAESQPLDPALDMVKELDVSGKLNEEALQLEPDVTDPEFDVVQNLEMPLEPMINERNDLYVAEDEEIIFFSHKTCHQIQSCCQLLMKAMNLSILI